MPVWVCIECKRVQTDNELQCVCGNINPEGFIEKDIHYEKPKVKKEVKKEAPKTMVEKTPHVELKSDIEKTKPRPSWVKDNQKKRYKRIARRV